MTTSPRPPETPEALEPADSPPVLSAQQRAALRAELSPLAADQARVRGAVWSSLATGELPRSVQRVDALMQARAAGGAKLIGGSGLSGKLLALGLLAAGAAGLIGWSMTRSPAPNAPAAPAASSVASAPGPTPTADTEPEPRTLAIAAPAPATPAAVSGELAAGSARGVAPDPSRSEAAEPAAPRLEKPGRTHASAHRTRATRQAPVEETSAPEQTQQASAAPPPAATPAPAPTPAPEAEPVPRFDLAAELRLVRGASRALDRGDAQAALAQLQQYAARYPSGALRVEAAALRAMALCTAHAPGADSERQRFLRDHASSALAERVKRACAEHP